MIRFTMGIMVGLTLDITAAASASYIGKEQWLRVPNGSDFHLGYVASMLLIDAAVPCSLANLQLVRRTW